MTCKDYIKTGALPRDLSPIITSAFDVRSDSDYDDYYIIDKEEVDIQIKNAQYFYNIVEVYTTQRIKSNS